MNKLPTAIAFLLAGLICQTMALSLRNNANHQYWFNKDNPIQNKNDDKWNYCDYKCLTFEKLVSGKDFVIITFKAPLKQDFSACYIKTGTTYTLWSKVTENKFYEKYCGEDYKDWVVEGGFSIAGVYGVGIGAPLNETQIYKKN